VAAPRHLPDPGCIARRPSARCTRKKSFVDLGEVFNNQILAGAILDRLLNHATTVNIKGTVTGCARKEEDRPAAQGQTRSPSSRRTWERNVSQATRRSLNRDGARNIGLLGAPAKSPLPRRASAPFRVGPGELGV
jgi:hypothetical protein